MNQITIKTRRHGVDGMYDEQECKVCKKPKKMYSRGMCWTCYKRLKL